MTTTIRKVRVNVAAVVGAFVLAAVLVLVAVPLAQANHGNKNTAGLEHVQQSHTSDCGVASVTLTVPDNTEKSAQSANWVYRLQVEVDGQIVGSTDLVKGPGTSTLDLTFDEDQSDGEVEVRYYYLDASEWDLVDPALNRKPIWPEVGDAFIAFTVNTDCQPEPEETETPTEPETTEEPETETPAKGDDAAGGKDEKPAAVPTAVPAGVDTLPATGVNPAVLTGVALLLVAAGGGLVLQSRRPARGRFRA